MRTLALALALSASTPAFALSCMDFNVEAALPADGATAVPTNARVSVKVFSWHEDQPAPTLFDADGNVVETTIEVFDGGTEDVFVLTPAAPLEAGATYTATVPAPWDDGSELHGTTFTVGTEADTTAPAAPTVTRVHSSSDTDEWGTWSDFYVEMPEQQLDDNGFVYELTITDERDGTTYTRFMMDTGDHLHDGPCSTDAAGALPARHTTVDVRAIDVAGNASDTTGPAIGTSGCSTTSQGPLSGLLVLLPLLGLRRRVDGQG